MKLGATVLVVLVACAQATPGPAVSGRAPPTPPRAAPAGVALEHAPGLHAVLRAPTRLPYLIAALGIGGQAVVIEITNHGGARVNFARPRIAFTAIREGVAFPCEPQPENALRDREPRSLAPAQSFVLKRALDCAMPLPGRYDVSAFLALTDARPGEDHGRGDPIGTFTLDVVEGATGPAPIQSRPGLFVAMTGSQATAPMSPAAWARGEYSIVLAAVNGGRREVAVGPARLTLSTYKAGSSISCTGQSDPVPFPNRIAPGVTHIVRVPVTCAPTEEGRYEIVGRVAFGEDASDSDATEVGRVALKVSGDPLLFAPVPFPLGPNDSRGTLFK